MDRNYILFIAFSLLLAVGGAYILHNHQQTARALERAEQFVEAGSKWGWYVKTVDKKDRTIELTLLSEWEKAVKATGNEEGIQMAIPYLKPCGFSEFVRVKAGHPAWEKYENLQTGDRIYFSLAEKRKEENWINYLDPI